MNERLKRILDRINVDKKYLVEFKDATLESVNIDELDNKVNIVIKNYGDISYDFYNELKEKFSLYFSDATIFLRIDNDSTTSNHFRQYFDMVVNNEEEQLPHIKLLLNKSSINGNSISVTACNEIEKKDFVTLLDKILDKIKMYGATFTYKIDIDESLSVNIENTIVEAGIVKDFGV